MTSVPERVAAVWVPDWSVLAAMTTQEVPAHVPAAVHDGRAIVDASAVARAQGVRVGMRRRHAQETCPDLVLLTADPGRDVRLFEQVVLAVETVVAGVEVARPGLVLLPSAGAGRYHGSEEALAAQLVEALGTAGHEAHVGVADGVGAAVLAARAQRIVPPGAARRFLAPLSVATLEHVGTGEPEVRTLVDLLHRLGLRTLGALAELPRSDVATRFGPVGVWAHRVASGDDDRPTALRRPEQDVVVAEALDPPVDRVERTAFVARRLAETLHARLVELGAACGRLHVAARTDTGEDLVRTWRTDAALGGLAVPRITDRVRWQLEGWLSRAAATGPGGPGDEEDPAPAALVHLELRAEDVTAAGAEQGRLWGGPSGGDQRAHRALHRVQGLLGADAVRTATVQGGRDLRDRVHLTTWGEREPAPRATSAPWPGRLPEPAPATVLVEPVPVQVVDADRRRVEVDARLQVSGEPAALWWSATAGEPEREDVVVAWAGPWPVVQRWWAGGPPSRQVYVQVLLGDGVAVLLVLRGGVWAVEARYD